MQMETDSDKNDNCIGLEGVTEVEAGCCLKYLIIDMEAARCCLTLEECECHQKIGKTLKWNALMMHVCACARVCVCVCRGGWEVRLCNGHFALFVFRIMNIFFSTPPKLWSVQTSFMYAAVFLPSDGDLTTQKMSPRSNFIPMVLRQSSHPHRNYRFWLKKEAQQCFFNQYQWNAKILASGTCPPLFVSSYSQKSFNAAPETTLEQHDTTL